MANPKPSSGRPALILSGLAIAVAIALLAPFGYWAGPMRSPDPQAASGCAVLDEETLRNVCDIPINVGICSPATAAEARCDVIGFDRIDMPRGFTAIDRQKLQVPNRPDADVMVPGAIVVHACPQPLVAEWRAAELRCVPEV